jgi:hypothetical protein
MVRCASTTNHDNQIDASLECVHSKQMHFSIDFSYTTKYMKPYTLTYDHETGDVRIWWIS